ncbi:MAG: major capsid protein [Microvirus sp.]|nr:MAG: major capsid protein [Microvirus sp.]
MMHRNKSVDVHQFAMTPKAEIPRSQFNREFMHKTTFDAGYLIPIYVDEVLPGDTFNLQATIFARMATPIFPIMDNLHLDSFFFFVPNRLIWNNWQRFMGQQDNPGDSISYEIPQITSPVGGYDINTIFDYMGLPTKGQVDPAQTVTHSSMWLRAYNLIYNEWFRDENLQDALVVNKTDTPDLSADYALQRRGKRHDYFTACLPWTQKGQPVLVPLSGTAPVIPFGTNTPRFYAEGNIPTDEGPLYKVSPNSDIKHGLAATLPIDTLQWSSTGLAADLSTSTAVTINQLRQSFQVQKLLERDARGGTRYTEIIRQHFGVTSPDARLQRPEYLGGGSTPVNINPVAQTSGSPGVGGYTDTPQGNLAAFGTVLAPGHGFSSSFTEHGVIIGLVSVRADLTYQQGLHKMWSRKTRYDFYFPAFAMLGEQAVLNKEIFIDGTPNDESVFGYQERWAEYRYKPSQISGLFKSTSTGTLDAWHLAQRFNNVPTLNSTFIQETPPMDRILAVGIEAEGQHFIMDSFFRNKVARTMPLYSVPGLIDHF